MGSVCLIGYGWLLMVSVARRLDGIVIGYLGPNSVLPIASALAALVGVILMFWGVITRWMRRAVRKIRNRNVPVEDVVAEAAAAATDDDEAAPPAEK